jgi:hypothetical protein
MEQAHMVRAEFVIRTINFKPGKDADGNEVTVAEVKLVTDDLTAATQLGWALRKLANVSFEFLQPTLPMQDEQLGLPNKNIDVTLPAREADLRADMTEIIGDGVYSRESDQPSDPAVTEQLAEMGTWTGGEQRTGLCAHGRYYDRACPECDRRPTEWKPTTREEVLADLDKRSEALDSR